MYNTCNKTKSCNHVQNVYTHINNQKYFGNQNPCCLIYDNILIQKDKKENKNFKINSSFKTYNFWLIAEEGFLWSNLDITNEISLHSWLLDISDYTTINIYDLEINGAELKCNIEATDGSLITIDLEELIEVKAIGQGWLNIFELNINNTQITNFNPILPLPDSLKELNLNDNQISIFNPIYPLPENITLLSLTDNNISNFNPNLNLPASLQYLQLGFNSILNFNLTLPLPQSLLSLVLNNNQILTFNPTQILPQSLSSLILNNNNIEVFNPSNLLPTSLTNLFISNNNITDWSLCEPWANLQTPFISLCTLNAEFNPISPVSTPFEALIESANGIVIY